MPKLRDAGEDADDWLTYNHDFTRRQDSVRWRRSTTNVGRLGLEKLIDVKEGKQYVRVFAGQQDGSRSFAPATALAQSRIYLFA
jgi:hypothetical protein